MLPILSLFMPITLTPLPVSLLAPTQPFTVIIDSLAPSSCPANPCTALPHDFSSDSSDAPQWIFSMKAYFSITMTLYDKDDKVLILLSKMNKGCGHDFSEGWYMCLHDETIPDSEKAFFLIMKDFIRTFTSYSVANKAHIDLGSLHQDL
ncbi:hypothetical protein J3R83DRAFT_7729 [Lanmaoa asiatica]|nr:hypothetical protein J3R83DRAFT_7729 [Lanmaoa asiatica]